MPARPDDRYEVRARIAAPASRGSRLAAVVVLAVVGGLAGVSLADRLSGGPEPAPSRPAASFFGATASLGVATPRPPLATGPRGPFASPPPQVSIFDSQRLPPEIPVLAPTLAWLRPARGELDPATGGSAAAWTSTLSDGRSVCVCVQLVGLGGQTSTEVFLFARDGATVSSRHLETSLGRPTARDSVLTPDGRSALVAEALPSASGVSLVLDRIVLDSGLEVTETVARDMDVTALGDLADVQLRLAVTPDGHRVRIGLDRIADDLGLVPGVEAAWTATIDGPRLGPIRALPETSAAGGPCRLQAYATDSVYVEICRISDGVRVFLEHDDGTAGEEDLFPADAQDDIGWLVDGSHGIVYGWSATGHAVYRLDIETLDVLQRLFGGPLGPDDKTPEAPRPAAGHGAVAWQPLTPASDPTALPVVGSPDGRLLYAVGLQSITDAAGTSALASTGLWVLDASTLAIVDHRPTLAVDSAIGITPDGAALLATGSPDSGDEARYGQEGTIMSVLSPIDGSPIAVLRELERRLGTVPRILPVTQVVAPVAAP